MQAAHYLFRRSKRRASPAVWPVGVRGWIFLLGCNLAFLAGMIAAFRFPFGLWTLLTGGLAALAIIALFAGLVRHTDWTPSGS